MFYCYYYFYYYKYVVDTTATSWIINRFLCVEIHLFVLIHSINDKLINHYKNINWLINFVIPHFTVYLLTLPRTWSRRLQPPSSPQRDRYPVYLRKQALILVKVHVNKISVFSFSTHFWKSANTPFTAYTPMNTKNCIVRGRVSFE